MHPDRHPLDGRTRDFTVKPCYRRQHYDAVKIKYAIHFTFLVVASRFAVNRYAICCIVAMFCILPCLALAPLDLDLASQPNTRQDRVGSMISRKTHQETRRGATTHPPASPA